MASFPKREASNRLPEALASPAALLQQGGTALRLPSGLRGEGPAGGLDPLLGRIGSLEVRLATSGREIRRAQRLRYKVFYEEMSAVPRRAPRSSRGATSTTTTRSATTSSSSTTTRRAEALPQAKPKVVGTYRLLRQEVAERHLRLLHARANTTSRR